VRDVCTRWQSTRDSVANTYIRKRALRSL